MTTAEPPAQDQRAQDPPARPRRRLLRRSLLWLGIVLLVIIVVAVVLLLWSVRRPFPTVDGIAQLAGLDGAVDVYRDGFGVPTIVAASELDLVRAQGYTHAQDRFWQMDVNRTIAAGRTAEMFGPDQLDVDRFLRTMGWELGARDQLEELDDELLAVLDAYAQGVNAYIADRPRRSLGLEYSVLGIINPEYRPEPWEPVHSLLFLYLLAFDLSGNMTTEIERAVLTDRLGTEAVADLFPPYPRGAPVIVPNAELPHDEAVRDAAVVPEEALPALMELEDAVAAVDAFRGGARNEGLGSNSWVVSGALTASGMPLLANDPHLGIGMPSIWYANALRCEQRTDACDLDVSGFSFPGVPGVIVGHNDRIAWGVTNLGADVQDLFVEQVDAEDRYVIGTRSVPMEQREEVLRASDGTEETLTVRTTRNGPILSGVYGPLDEWDPGSTFDGGGFAVALRWTAQEHAGTFRAVHRLNRASDWEEFRAALADFDVPGQNFTYADIEGNIGYQATGVVPIRAAGDGTLPVPAWEGDHAWTGAIPYERMPSRLNPPTGFIATANNRVAGESYPYFLGQDWDYGHRAARIETLITEADGPIGVADLEQMQHDNYEDGLRLVVPALLAVESDEPGVGAVQELLAEWDGHMDVDSSGGAAYAATWRQVLQLTFHDKLPERYWPNGRSRWLTVVGNLVEDPHSDWWDRRGTDAVETRDDIFALAMSRAHTELTDRLGADPAGWAWGDLHTATFRNATLGESGVAPIERLFNRGPYPVGGGFSIVNATGWTPHLGYEVVWLPSLRMIVDLASLDSSRGIHTTGQSGHAFHRDYTSMIERWRDGEQRPMRWSLGTVRDDARNHLRLEPDP
jgi:penicillin G amidase